MSVPPRPADPSSPVPGDDGLENLLVQALDRLERDGPAGVERLLAEHPAVAERIRAHLGQLHRIGFAGSEAVPAEHPERLGEFRIVAPLGQGGMGVVYRAVQESLGREVALKLIRPDQLYFPGARERFRREVELVARMQHPGIVPIHAVGTDQGVPYFAMELVHGATLAAVLERLHGAPPAALTGRDLDRTLAESCGDTEAATLAPLFDGPWCQVALRIVREVADALEHAHRRGVLHRDVKPSNIMLTRSGRVLLLDFGLAGAEGQERVTRSGSALGSLAYMPPEVLAGEGAERDARGDVYSLGTTLWELLTLRLPYQNSDPLKLRELAGTAARPPLVSLNKAVPWDVEVVVATAMEPQPARRYVSAAAFSRDLEHLLAHRPIEARDGGSWLRLRRWSQRHPARATALVAAGFIAFGGPSLWAFQEARARERIEQQRDQLREANVQLDRAKAAAEAESARAQQNFDKLLAAVDTMLTKVGDESLKDIPRMEVVRRDLLAEARRFYEGFLAEQPDDPRLRREAGLVHQRLADLHASLGDYKQAQAEVAAAIAAMESVVAPDLMLRLKLAQARARLATAKRLGGDLPGAGEAVAVAVAEWQGLAAERATAPVMVGLGEARLEASLIAADRGDLPGAFAALDASITAIDGFEPETARPLNLRALLARTLQRSAVWSFQLAMQSRDRQVALPKIENAVERGRRAQQLWQQILAEGGDSGMRADAAQCAVNTAISLQSLRKLPEATEAMALAVPILEQLVADFPAAKRRRAELANARSNYASLLAILDDEPGYYREQAAAQVLWEQLVAEAPESDEYAIGLSHSLQSRAAAMLSSKRSEQAPPLLALAMANCDRALAVRPDNPTYRRVRRKIAETLAEVYLQLQRHDEAAVAARELMLDRLAPKQPALAAGLIARTIPLVQADTSWSEAERASRTTALQSEARTLLLEALDKGMTLQRLRQDPALGNQWEQSGFAELVKELEAAGR